MPNWGALSSAPGITMDRNSVAAPSRSSRVTVTSQRPAARKRPATAFARDMRGRQQLDGVDGLFHAGSSSAPGA